MKKVKSKVNRLITAMLVMCLCLTQMPVMGVMAATEASVSVKSSVSAPSIYPDQTTTVNITVKGIPGTTDVVPTDVVLILDQSGSMQGTKMDVLKEAAIKFIDTIDYASHRVGLISYASDVTNNISFSTDKDLLTTTVSGISASGGTYIGTAINAAVDMMKNDRRDGAKPVIVIVTDGMASDPSETSAAAKAAKDLGFIFYTIALFENETQAEVQGTTEYNANEMLKSMATTAIHHHFVGADGLVQAYADIASDIGIENPYNVKITQQIADEFEYVVGSADNNVPKPTISGNTLTWEMLELKDTTLKLSYQIRPKSGVIGTYAATSVGQVEFETYAGDVKTVDITSPNVTVMEIPDLTSITMSPTTGVEGKEVKVRVDAAGLYYGSGFKVTLGGKEMEIATQSTSYFKFVVPADLAVGTYEVVVYNGDGSKSAVAGQYECTPRPEVIVTDITPTSGIVGIAETVKVTAENLSYPDGFAVTLGGEAVTITNPTNEYFKFKTPTNLAVGTYDIVLYEDTNHAGKVIGQYTYEPEPTPDPMAITGMSPTSGPEGEAETVKVTGTNLVYEAGFSVTLGGKNVAVSNQTSSYFKFTTPTDLVAGTYDVVVYSYDGHAGEVIGQYTYEAEVTTIDPMEITGMSPTSGQVGEAETVKVTGTNLTYGEGFAVTLGGKAVTPTNMTSTYFKFETPTDLAEGSYDVVVYSYTGHAGEVIGQYTYEPEPTPEPMQITGMSPTSGIVGEAESVQVTGTSLSYGEGFRVTLGDQAVTPTNLGGSYFKFKTPTNLAEGTYDVVVYSYTGHAGAVIGQYTYEPAPTPEPMDITGMSPTSGIVGEAESITVTGTSLSYGEGFRVTLGDKEVTPTNLGGSYFKFRTPKDLAEGTYDVVVYSYTGHAGEVIGTYTYEPAPTPDPLNITGMSPTSGIVGEAESIKVTGEGLSYIAGFRVTLGGKDVTPTNLGGSYFKFKTPTDLPEGTYDVVVYSYTGHAGEVIGQYTYGPVPPPDPMPITGMTPTSGIQGNAVTIKVTGTGLSYSEGFKVTIGGKEVETSSHTTSYFKFKTPTDLAVGTHDVVVHSYTGHAGEVIGQYTCEAPPPGEVLNITGMTPTSGAAGRAVTVKVTGTNLSYVAGFRVTIGGQDVTPTNKTTKYFKFKTPTNLAAGTYDVVVYSYTGHAGEVVGQYTVN